MNPAILAAAIAITGTPGMWDRAPPEVQRVERSCPVFDAECARKVRAAVDQYCTMIGPHWKAPRCYRLNPQGTWDRKQWLRERSSYMIKHRRPIDP